jgi:hypothetical protein
MTSTVLAHVVRDIVVSHSIARRRESCPEGLGIICQLITRPASADRTRSLPPSCRAKRRRAARSRVRAAPAARAAIPRGVVRTSARPAPGVILIPARLDYDRGGGGQAGLDLALGVRPRRLVGQPGLGGSRRSARSAWGWRRCLRCRADKGLCLSQTYWLAVDRESGDADL